MNYQGFNIVTTSENNTNIVKSLRPRMVVTYQLDEGLWVALAYNELGFVVDSIASTQVQAVDTAIQKAISKLDCYKGFPVKKKNITTSHEDGTIYWEQPNVTEEYQCEIRLLVEGIVNDHNRARENSRERPRTYSVKD